MVRNMKRIKVEHEWRYEKPYLLFLIVPSLFLLLFADKGFNYFYEEQYTNTISAMLISLVFIIASFGGWKNEQYVKLK